MKKYVIQSYLGSVSALGVATCCVLPMAVMLLGFGGSWLAVFGKIAAGSYYVLAISTALVAIAWFLSHRNRALGQLKWWLAGSSLITALAWVIVFKEAQINDYLIMKM